MAERQNLTEESKLRLRNIIARKPWFGFDLDDTLHDFRGSSKAATSKVLAMISGRYGTSLEELRETYSRILKENTTNAFSDGKTSFEYRRARFGAVLAHFAIPDDNQFMDELLEQYENTLMASLELKAGALNLLISLKNAGKKIVIVTEGPQDAQERALQKFGISEFVDFLATTNRFGAAKTDGLFPIVLQYLGIKSGDIVYIGDSEERDMRPAMTEGIFCVHFCEEKSICLDRFPVCINSLGVL